MKKNNILKKILLLVVINILFIFVNQVKADTKIDPNKYTPSSIEMSEEYTAVKFGNKIIGGFQAIGSIVSVLALCVIGIKYMIETPEEKSQDKERLVMYVVGAILVFAISNISAIVYKAVQPEADYENTFSAWGIDDGKEFDWE